MNTDLITKEQCRARNDERGIAYVVLLIYLTIMTCLGLSFIHRVGTEAKIVMNKTKSSQAHYLAESAASHAMWGMLNVPGFAPNGSMYYMHSFANGRYGYKVRKPTLTTFATIAAIGAIGESVVEQGYVPYILPSNFYTAYGSSSNGVPFYRRLIGADWNAPNDVLLGGGSGPWWVELEGCPVRNELICGIIDSIGEIKVAVYDGTTWGNAQPFGHGDQNYKCFDIAYESQSGDALVVARDGTATPLYYNIWDGAGWVYGNPQTAVSLAGGNIHDVVMASQPGGDEILIGVLTSWDEIQLVRWDGSAFSDLGTIESQAATNDFRKVEIIYEHQSGDAMVVWSRNGDSALKFRMWNGAVLGPEGSLPDFGGNENYVIRGAADSDPASDYIVIGAVDNFYDLSVAIWDGDNWIDSREVDIATATNMSLVFDVAWEAAGEDVVIAWAPWSATNVRSIAWKKGTNLADCVIQEGPSLQTQGWLVRLLPISGTEKIVLLGETTSNVLRYCLWTGDKFRGDPTVLIESNVPVQNDVAFDLAEANVPRTGGTGSGGGGGGPNTAPTVDAGSDQIIYLPSDATLYGTVTDDGLPDPPATVTTTWTKESGPGTVTFGDASLVDTTASFSEAGTYVLRLTADDSDLNDFDEVTIVVSSLCLGLVGYWELDETSGAVASDSSGNGNNGMLVNMDPATDWVSGHIGGGLDFDGADDYINVPHDANLSLAGGMTFTAWGNTRDTGGGYKAILAKDLPGNGLSNYWFGISNDELVFGLWAAGGFQVVTTPSSNLQPSTWYHLAATFDPVNDVIRLYVDGLEVHVGPFTYEPTTETVDLWIGTSVDGEDWDGKLDELRIYNRVLDPGEIAQLHALTSGGCVGGGVSRLLFVVDDASSLSSEESQRKILMEGCGFIVTLIDDGDTQASFDAAAGANNVAYISQEAVATTLGSKLKNTPIGVVNENKDMIDDFGFATGVSMGGGLPTLNVDMSHYITGVFTANPVAPYVANEWYQIVNEPVASGVEPVGTWAEAPYTGKPALMTIYQGAQLIGGGTATGCRVQIPWGSGQGTTPVALASLSNDAKTIMQRSIQWAASCGGGSCNFVPDTKIGEFSTSTYGSGGIAGLAFLPEGTILSTETIPAGGALLSVDVTSDMFYLTDLSGNPFISLPTGSGTHTGVTLVQSGPWANHIAVSDKFSDEIKYFDLTGSFVNSFSTNVSTDFDGTTPEDVAFIGITASGMYDNHLAIPDYGKNKVYLVDQNGSWVSSIDTSSLTNNLMGAVHLPGTDMLLLVDLNGRAYIINFAGNVMSQYDTTTFGADSPGAVTINPLNCNHLIGDDSPDLIVTLSLSGGGTDTNPPTPNPMTWATLPAPDSPTSIRMMATTGTDPSGVMYYFECTSGGCNDSGWQDSPIYIDSGLTPDTSYTYRVKATDKASPPNETGWSTEESATTPSTPEMFVTDITMGFRTQGPKYFGQATVWIKDDMGMDVSGALVVGDWSGAVSEGAMGSTGGDGKIFFESGWVNGGGTYTFTVTDVTKSGYVYNPALNVETSDSVTAP